MEKVYKLSRMRIKDLRCQEFGPKWETHIISLRMTYDGSTYDGTPEFINPIQLKSTYGRLKKEVEEMHIEYKSHAFYFRDIICLN